MRTINIRVLKRERGGDNKTPAWEGREEEGVRGSVTEQDRQREE